MSAEYVYPYHVQQLIEQLQHDEFFQADIRTPQVKEAVEHWLGIKRLSSEEADRKFNDNYRVLQTFAKFRNLQELCQKEGCRFPLELLLIDEAKILAARKVQAAAGEQSIGNDKKGVDSKKKNDTKVTKDKEKLEGVLKPSRNEGEPRVRKESSVRFAEPAKEVEITYPVQSPEIEVALPLLNYSIFSMEPSNVARWWGLQFFFFGVFIASKFV